MSADASDLRAAVEAYRTRAAMGRWLDLSVEDDLFRLTFHERHIGNPMIRALHGGVISAFLETCATLAVTAGTDTAVRTISTHINFLRGAVDRDMMARVQIARRGRRIAFVEATGWQTDEAEPVARAAIALRIFAAADAPAASATP